MRISIQLLAILLTLPGLCHAHGRLGVRLQDLDPSLAVQFGLTADDKGVLVADVTDQSPAKAAGLVSGDVIRTFAGHEVDSAAGLRLLAAATDTGQEVVLGVWRASGAVDLRVKMGPPGSSRGRRREPSLCRCARPGRAPAQPRRVGAL